MLTTLSANKTITKSTRETARGPAIAKKPSQLKEFYNVSELAERFGLKPVTIRRMTERGELPYYSIGRSLRFRSEDVEEFLQRCKSVAQNE